MTATELDANTLELVARLQIARSARKEIEREEAELRDAILKALEANETSVGLTASGDVAVELITQVRRTINRPKLEAIYPEIFESVVEDKVVTMVKAHDVAIW